MASIEQRGNSYRIVFRFGGRKFARSLETTDGAVAVAALHRLEDNLRCAKLGTFAIPSEADPATYLLSDGTLCEQPAYHTALPEKLTFASLCEKFINSMPENAIEKTTLCTIQIHLRHLKRFFGAKVSAEQVNQGTIQDYVNQRAKSPGRHGRILSAVTLQTWPDVKCRYN